MKVAIDITPLKSAHRYRGVGSYTKNLIRALKKYKPENQYILFTRSENLPKNVDLVHYPFFDPFFLTLPLFKKYKTVVTIHDLIPLVFPDKFPRGIRGEIKWQLQKFSLKSASVIITDSENSKKDIIKFTNFPKEKIYIIPLAPGEEFKPLDKNNELLVKTKVKYKLPECFVLYVGDVNWNKNIQGLIKAFYKLYTTHATIKDLKLVLVGKVFKDKELKENQEIDRIIEELELHNYVLKLGFVPGEDLVAIYNLASVYCQPSFYEGFGLPPLEAMACGTPVVVADIPTLKEVCGKAAVYVDPYDSDDIAKGILNILPFDTIKYRRVVKKSLRRVKKFNWKNVARETVRVYKEVLL